MGSDEYLELLFVLDNFREILITYISPSITLELFNNEIRDMCKFTPDQHFTTKWVDEEGIYRILQFLCHTQGI